MSQNLTHKDICNEIYNNMLLTIDKMDQNSFSENAELKGTADRNTNTLKELFKNLLEYNKNKLDGLVNTVKQDIIQKNHSSENPGDIYTALVDRQFLSKESSRPFIHFYSMETLKNTAIDGSIRRYSPKQKENFIGVFFKSSYDDFTRITNGNTNLGTEYHIKIKYKNKDEIQAARCKFIKSYTFVESEQLLKKVACQYGFDKPLIYSPYARRFAEIRFTDTVNVDAIDKIIFDKEISQFIEATTLEKTLVWNIEFKNSCSAFSDTISEETIKKLSSETIDDKYISNEYIIPDFDSSTYKYKKVYKCHPNEYLLFDGIGHNRIGIGREKKQGLLYILCDSSSKPEPLIKLIVAKRDHSDIQKIDPSHIFQNYYLPGLFVKQRLHSYADICYAVNGFNKNPYGIEISVSDKMYQADNRETADSLPDERDNFISDYNTFDRYYEHADPKSEPDRTIKITPKTYCTLIFHKTDHFRGNINFIEDYARYVLSYLNEKYPEFAWKGKKGWLE